MINEKMRMSLLYSKWNKMRVKRLPVVVCLFFIFHSLTAQQLQSFISEAEESNPQIKALQLRHETAREKINETNSLPNTELSAGYFASRPETRTGAQVARFSVRQMLPWFGTRSARRGYAERSAATEDVELQIARRKLGLEVAQSYYRLHTLDQKQHILKQNDDLLAHYETLALNAVEADNASAVDVLRIQMRQNNIKKQRSMLQERYKAEEIRLHSLLNRPENLGFDLKDSLFIPQEMVFTETATVRLHPELHKYEALYEAIAASEALNQKEKQPMLGLGLDYIPVTERVGMDFSDNGKDILMPMLSLSIPIFNTSYNSKSKQNELKLQEIEAQKAENLNALQRSLADAVSAVRTARINYFTQESNLKKAKNAEEILLKTYETGSVNFTDVLDVQELQLQFQLEQQEAVQDYFTNAAILNYLTNE